jgi:ribosomal protein L16 Arg81 hydroxylase
VKLHHAEFWQEFMTNYWERTPATFSHGFTDPPLDPQQLFEVILAACARSGGNISARLFVGGQVQEGEIRRGLLPRREDKNLHGFHVRMKEVAGNAGYAMIVNNLEGLSFELWNWSREFLRPLFQARGMNSLGCYYALFLGDYWTTPAGVHHDPESVFHFPVVGLKRIRAWEPAYIANHPRMCNANSYEEHLDASVLLEAESGGMIYWPSGLWHVGESTGEFTASLALSMLCINPLSPMFTLYLRQLLEASAERTPRPPGGTEYPFDPDNLQATACATPPALAKLGAQMRRLYDEEQLATLWMRLCTGYGFYNPPPALDGVTITLEDSLCIDPRYPIVWRHARHGGLQVSANGGLFQTVSSVARGLEVLNRGEPISVRRIVEESGASPTAEATAEVLKLLEQIVAWRGAHKVSVPAVG